MEKKKDCPNKLLTTLMIVCVTLSVVILGIISYDKFVKKDEEKVVPVVPQATGQSSTNCENSNFGEKVYTVNKIDLSNINQKVTIGNKTFNLKVDNHDNTQDVLYINDEVANSYHGYNNFVILVPPVAYQTEKYIIFTSVGQDDDGIDYAIDENGKEIVINDNGYQMHGFKIVDGYLHATGHIFCGLECDISDKELVIKYIDNTLIVTEAK